MKKIILPIVFILPLFTAYLSAQPTTNKSKEYNVVYLLHLKFYAAWPRQHERPPNHSPRYVLSLDTVEFKVNDSVEYNSPGLKREPAFRNGIIADVIKLKFPKGDTVMVKFGSSFNKFKNYSILNRSWDTTINISNADDACFFFIANRGIPRKGRNNFQLAWRLFDSNNTRKQLAKRLRGMLEGNIVHRIVIE